MPSPISAQEAIQEFQREAHALWEELNRWWNAHPQATLTEIEQHLRPLRRHFEAKLVALQVLQRGAGAQDQLPACPQCGQPMEDKGIQEKPVVGMEIEGKIPHTYYHCPHCGEGFSPLKEQFRLTQRSPWTEWLEEEACQLAITTPSYQIAEERFERLTGAAISDSTIWRKAGPVGEQMLAVLAEEEAQSNAPLVQEEAPGTERVAAADPLIGEQASVSIDGGLVCVRQEGWKEVKGVAISAVQTGAQGRGRRRNKRAQVPARPDSEPEVHLGRHSYRMRLAEAEEFARVQGAEADRRRVHYAAKLGCVHDGGPWIWRISQDYYPEAIEVLDWDHGVSYVSKVAQAAFGEGSTAAGQWLEEVKELLWAGDVEQARGAKWAELPRRQGERGKTIRNGKAYLLEHQERMRYKTFREQGYPIGSGTIESGVKNVVQWRMKRGGARWARERVNPMVVMLGEYHSGRWAERWAQIHQAEEKCA